MHTYIWNTYLIYICLYIYLPGIPWPELAVAASWATSPSQCVRSRSRTSPAPPWGQRWAAASSWNGETNQGVLALEGGVFETTEELTNPNPSRTRPARQSSQRSTSASSWERETNQGVFALDGVCVWNNRKVCVFQAYEVRCVRFRSRTSPAPPWYQKSASVSSWKGPSRRCVCVRRVCVWNGRGVCVPRCVVFDLAAAQAQRRREVRNRPLFHPEKDIHEGVLALEGCVFETTEGCVLC